MLKSDASHQVSFYRFNIHDIVIFLTVYLELCCLFLNKLRPHPTAFNIRVFFFEKCRSFPFTKLYHIGWGLSRYVEQEKIYIWQVYFNCVTH